MTHTQKTTIPYVLVLCSALLLIVLYVVPIWRIDLSAPQYPEGLYMNIHIDKLSGDVEKISNLNHYIGMSPISEGMFPEFGYLIYLLGGIIGVGIFTFILKKPWLLYLYVALLLLGGVAALIDMYKWGYDYGHNLDPHSAIQIPGMTYQPPLIGYKQLLNFGAWSLPDTGGWLSLVSFLLAILAVIFLIKRQKSIPNSQSTFVTT
jgi:copper chaperone NosL